MNPWDVRVSRTAVAFLIGHSYRTYTGNGPVFNATAAEWLERLYDRLPEADRPTLKTSRRKGFGDPDWSVLLDAQIMVAAESAARSVAKEFRDRGVNMLCEHDDLRQEAILLAARALGANPEFAQFPAAHQQRHIWLALRDQVKYRIEPASATIYQSTLEQQR